MGDEGQQISSTNSSPKTGPVMAQELNSATIGIIVGVAVAMLATLIALVWCLVRQRQQHQRRMADLEERANAMRDQQAGHAAAEVAQMNGVPISRPRNVLRRATFLPFGTRVGWDTLESREDVSRLQGDGSNMSMSVFTRPVREKRNSNPLSWPFSRQPVAPEIIPMDDVSHGRPLSTVVENPITEPFHSQNIATRSSDAPTISQAAASPHGRQARTIRRIDSVSELRPDPLIVDRKRARSKTIGSTSKPMTPRTEPSKVTKRPRSATHVRSFSLGSQSPGGVPQHAVPPLPLTVRNVEIASRPKSCYTGNAIARMSVSSLESIGSSLLASPRLQRSASERSARLQHVARRDYTNSLITGPRPIRSKVNRRPQSSPEQNAYLQSLRGSIKSNVDSMQSDAARPLSVMTAKSDADVPSVKTAEAVRLNRISLVPAGTPYQSNITPRRQSRITVSENGSPGQRVRSVALREIPGNARLSRQCSQASTDASSTRSSNGNPFQFDPSPMASGKPSALKGSPNARGKHRRSQVVRINISPQVINPKRGSTPLMADIQEESPENVAKVPQFSSSMGPLPHPPKSPRPPSTATFEPQLKLRPRTFVASLTADSPTLSSMSFMQDYKRSSTASSSTTEKDANRLSFGSIFIPSFPSPGKASLTTNVMPTPTFSYTRPSNELERDHAATEAMMLLACPCSAREQEDIKISASERQAGTRKASRGSTTGELIFPTLEKEQLKASTPPFDHPMIAEVDLASSPGTTPSTSPQASPEVVAQGWISKSGNLEFSRPMSPPMSPKSSEAQTKSSQGSGSGVMDGDATSAHIEQDAVLRLHSPSAIPGLNIYTSPLMPPNQVGPPASELCLSIAELRRMNSDAKHDAENPRLKAARRYQRMGRGESPQVISRDSVESLCEIDHALDFGVGDTVDDDSIIYGDSPGGSAGKENIPTVWEDGEDYWNTKSKLGKRISSSPLLSSRDVSPLSQSNVQNRDNMGIQSPLVHRRVSEMRGSAILEKLPLALKGLASPDTPQVVIQPPSSPASSLYDANGFLRT